MIRLIGCYHVTKFRYSTPSVNVLPEAVLQGVFIEKHVYTKFCLEWILCE